MIDLEANFTPTFEQSLRHFILFQKQVIWPISMFLKVKISLDFREAV